MNLEQKGLKIKVDILRKWKVQEEQVMAERHSLKKINKDRPGREVITTAISFIIEMRKAINANTHR